MSKHLIAAVALGGISATSLALSTAGALTDSSALAFNRIHAAIAALAAMFAALLFKTPWNRRVAVLSLGLVVLTLVLGLFELALVCSAVLDGFGLQLNSVVAGIVFLAQGLCTLRALQVRMVFDRTDPPSGPGPLAPA